MKLVRRILALIVAAAVVLFAVSNRGEVTIGLWPLPYVVTLPLFAIALAAAFVGFLAGAVVAWASASGARQRARRLESALISAERETTILKRRADRAEEAATAGPGLVQALPAAGDNAPPARARTG